MPGRRLLHRGGALLCASIRTPRMAIARYKHYHRGLESGPAFVVEVKRGRSEMEPGMEAAEDKVLRPRQGEERGVCSLWPANQLRCQTVDHGR